MATILMHLQDPAPSAVERNPDLPPELDTVIKKALAKKPEERFDSVDKLASAVTDALQGRIAHTPVVLREAAQQSIDLTLARRKESQEQIDATLAAFAAERGPGEATAATDSQSTPLKQNKLVSALHADFSEFSEILYEEVQDDEVVEGRLQSLKAEMRSAILENGGQVESYRSDSVTAIWGVEKSREDDAGRAIRAALRMQTAVLKAAGTLLEEEEELPLRIGVSTGLVLITADRGSGKFQATGGSTLNIANRLAQASSGDVLIAHSTYRHVRGIFVAEEDSPIKIRGRRERIPVYRVTGAKPRAFRLDTRVVEGVETRMIGRESELKMLQEITMTVKEEGETQIVTVVGDAGSGKSRLLYEWLNWEELLPDDMWAFHGRPTRDSQNVPYALIRDLFVFRFEIQDTDSSDTVREKFEKGVEKFMGKGNKATAHLIGQLTGFDFSDSPHLEGLLADPKLLHDKALKAIGGFFSSLAGEENDCTDIWIEDMHWADDRSLDVLNHLVEENQELYLLVIGLARPELYERRPQWGGGQEFHTRIDLRPLPKRSTRLLVKEILQKVEDIPRVLRDLVVERSEGNPFYVEELIKMLIEDRVIVKNDDKTLPWHVEMGRLASVRVPPTLTGLIQARLDGLFPAERTLLQRASVIGRVFWDSALRAMQVADGIHVDIDSTLKELRERELIYAREESAFVSSTEYIFGNNMLRDVLYETILKSQKSSCHAALADWLIDVSGDRAEEYTALIAQHYEAAEMKLEAAEYLHKAGEQASNIGAYQEASSFFRRGLALLEGRQDSASKNWASLSHRQLGLILEDQGQRASAVEHLDTCLAISRELEDLPGVLEALTILGQVTSKWGKFDGAQVYLEEALELAETLGDKRGMAHALMWSGANSLFREQVDTGEEYLARALPLAREAGDQAIVARTLNILGENARWEKNYEAATERYSEALELYKGLGNQFGVGLVKCNLGHVGAATGEVERAWEYYLEALKTTMSLNAVPVALEALAGMANLKANEGEAERGVELLGLTVNHKLTDVDTKDFAEPILERLKSTLPEDRYEAALARGSQLELDTVVDELLGA
jgi:class 3 adenylate cyclase/tetratricopeptide (TPR) repeat protein/type II secretory pathway predicted ATPase ExeA